MYEYIETTKNKYDVIVLNDVIEHIPKEVLLKYFVSQRRLLNKNGILLIKTVN